MKRLLTILLCLLIAIWVGFLIHQDAGYVLVGYGNYTIETSIWVALCLVILFFFMLSMLFWLFKRFSGLGAFMQRWGSQRKKNHALQQLHNGLKDLAEGAWQKAEKRLTSDIKQSPIPLINTLGAAYAAQELGQIEQRDQYLRDAAQVSPQSDVAISLMQANLQMQNHQWEQALATLRHLQSSHPKHQTVIKRLVITLQQLELWQELIELLPHCQRIHALPSEQLDVITLEAYRGLINQTSKLNDLKALHHTWGKLPRALREHDMLLIIYLEALLQNHDDDTATNLIATHMRRRWRVSLLPLYARAKTQDVSQQLITADNWLHQHPGEPELLTCIGQLCLKAQRYERAEYMLQEAVNKAGSQPRYRLLGEALEALNKPQEAIAAYRKALCIT